MDYADFLEDWTEKHLYSQMPKGSDVWENDVFEVLRQQWADLWKGHLGQLSLDEVQSDAGKAIVESIQLDVFGIRSNDQRVNRASDSAGATVVQLVPLRETHSLEDVLESMQIAALHAAYKFYKWGKHTEISDLLTLCEDVPPHLRADYKMVFSILTMTIMNAHATLHADIVAKPNFGRLEQTAKLHNQLKCYGERIWEIIGDSATLQEESGNDTEEEYPESDEWDDDEEE